MTGEDWQLIMYSAFRGLRSPVAALFFLGLFVVGNYILLNLFVAILISCLDSASRAETKKKNAAARLLRMLGRHMQPLKEKLSHGAKRARDSLSLVGLNGRRREVIDASCARRSSRCVRHVACTA